MKQPGFSLLEMLVTLMILAAMAAITIPAVVNRRKPSLNPVALQSLLTQARVASLASSTSVTVKFDLSRRKIAVNDGFGSLTFSDYTQVRVAFGREQAAENIQQEIGEITFYPDGRSTGGTVEVRNGSTSAYKLAVRWQDGVISYALQ